MFKKISPIVGILVLLNSCTPQEKKLNQDEIVKSNVEAYLMPNLNDPKSYEFVELTLLDSTVIADCFRHIKRSKEYNIKVAQRLLEDFQDQRGTYDDNDEDNYREDIRLNKEILSDIDSVEVTLNDKINEVTYYTYLFKFRSNNSFGALVLGEYYLHIDPNSNYKVIELTDDSKRKILSYKDFPTYSEFPGYIEVLKANGTERGW